MNFSIRIFIPVLITVSIVVVVLVLLGDTLFTGHLKKDWKTYPEKYRAIERKIQEEDLEGAWQLTTALKREDDTFPNKDYCKVYMGRIYVLKGDSKRANELFEELRNEVGAISYLFPHPRSGDDRNKLLFDFTVARQALDSAVSLKDKNTSPGDVFGAMTWKHVIYILLLSAAITMGISSRIKRRQSE